MPCHSWAGRGWSISAASSDAPAGASDGGAGRGAAARTAWERAGRGTAARGRSRVDLPSSQPAAASTPTSAIRTIQRRRDGVRSVIAASSEETQAVLEVDVLRIDGAGPVVQHRVAPLPRMEAVPAVDVAEGIPVRAELAPVVAAQNRGERVDERIVSLVDVIIAVGLGIVDVP